MAQNLDNEGVYLGLGSSKDLLGGGQVLVNEDDDSDETAKAKGQLAFLGLISVAHIRTPQKPNETCHKMPVPHAGSWLAGLSFVLYQTI